MSISETLYNRFDMERVCIDKVFFVVYDQKYAQEKHFFDEDLKYRFINNIKRSRVHKGQFSEVLRTENDYSSWELQLNGSRTMYFHVNVIHLLQSKYNIKPDNVIYDDNFMPVDTKLTIVDYVTALTDFVKGAKEVYHRFVLKHWGEDLQNIEVKISQIEFPFEVYPASVEDIAAQLYSQGITFRKYNTQSGTLYLDPPDKMKDKKIKFPDRKYDKDFRISDKDLTPDIVYMNGINSGYNGPDNKVQVKIYQKTFGLVRIEVTAYANDTKAIFGKFSQPNETIAETLVRYVHYILELNGVSPVRYDRTLDDVVKFLSVALKEDEDMIYRLRGMDVFEASRQNQTVRRRLYRKGIIFKRVDSDGVASRGVYLVNPIIRDLLNKYEPRGNEHYLDGGLCPDLI